jgi:glyoxylase-like metal-dependent hydrolase (beta-lactamase superfamily II)
VVLAPGVRWSRIPLPMTLDHINVWIIDHAEGCVVVDTGLANTECEETWRQLEREVFSSRPLRGVFVTHVHSDHLGLASWLQQRHNVPIWMSRRTHEQMTQLLEGDSSVASAKAEQFLTTHGANTSALTPFLSTARFARMRSGMPDVAPYVTDGQTLRWGATTWTALETNGHAEGHLCLHNQELGLLICGDQLLPTISPNVGLGWRSHDLNPLDSFLSSLERLSALPRDTCVLPSHGVPFRGLHVRANQLQAHHSRKLAAVTGACQTPKTAHELLPVMYRRTLEGMHLLLAMNEALAHLEYLVQNQRLRRETDREGIVRYVAVT